VIAAVIVTSRTTAGNERLRMVRELTLGGSAETASPGPVCGNVPRAGFVSARDPLSRGDHPVSLVQ
jgi:hypothetical protein